MTETTNATTRLAMMRAVKKLQQANIARVKGSPGVGYSVEQMAEIVERESGYRELYEALEAALALFSKDHALDHFNWGASTLRAEDICELNELPLMIRAALTTARGDPRA